MGNKLITIARIKGAHGVKGEARLQSFTAEREACFTYGPFLNEAGAPFLTPVKWRPVKDGFVVTLKENLSREEVDSLRGTNLYAPREALPAPDEDEFYITDLLGLTALDQSGQLAGKIAAVQNFGAGDLLEIDGPKGRFFVAFTREAVPAVDIAARTVTIVPPDLSEDG
ncbi:ribosome maturation factor RimM [Hyphobacterium sp.]|uniref:ribosome maturation factor RimM n=1 Tax=Hyphobacterium sp. TaxID=2004662 RepID=UPI003BAA6FF9